MSSSKINVYFRKKPFNPLTANDEDIIKYMDKQIYVKNLKPRVSSKSHYMEYNANLIAEDMVNGDVYRHTIKSGLDKLQNILLIAYGQTGSGKTHTLCGNSNEDGLITQVIRDKIDQGLTCQIKALEIYQNEVYDLLSVSKTKLFFYESNKKVIFKTVPNQFDIMSHEELNDIYDKISKNKQMGCTKINQTSSRAHTIYHCVFSNSQSFVAIDLAGNERGYLTSAVNSQQNREYISINQSLFALKECIRSIFLNKSYIPYRRSKLTILLREFLTTKIHLHFIGTLNPSKICYPDITDTIEYGLCLKKSKMKKLLKHVSTQEFLVTPRDKQSDIVNTKDYYTNQNKYVKHDDSDKRPSTSVNNENISIQVRNIKSEPALTKNKFLEDYHKFIIRNYTLGRKHARIYNLIKSGNNIPFRKIRALIKEYNEAASFIS
tara:strand:+ start:9694 stop:10995 length:1302 start_codon:yes stop_codon:yes gene_type:complete